MAFRVNHNIPALNALRNLNSTDDDMTRTLERLSSGLKINKGSDGPAALVISEQMRGQIASIQQSILNSEASVSMVQTAEATLSELNRMLISIRQLAIHAANEGVNDDKMLAADQAEVENALDTIDRIAKTSQFGSRTLFDGSNGVSGVTVGPGLEFVAATEQTRASPADGYPVNITQPATRAEVRGVVPIELEVAFAGADTPEATTVVEIPEFEITISEGGKTVTFSSESPRDSRAFEKMASSVGAGLGKPEVTEMLQEYVAQRLQDMADQNGLEVEVFLAKEGPGIGATGAGAIGAGTGAVVGAAAGGATPALIGGVAGGFAGAALGGDEINVLVVRHKKFGSEPTLFVSNTVPGILALEADSIQQAQPGRDVAGTIAAAVGLGKGEVLIAPPGVDPEGLQVKFNSVRRFKQRIPKMIPADAAPAGSGNMSADLENEMMRNPEIRPLDEMELKAEDFADDAPDEEILAKARAVKREDEGEFAVFTWEMPNPPGEGPEGFVHVDQNSLAFQVGPTQESQVKIGLLDLKSQRLGTNIENNSGFASLREVDVTTAEGALDTLALVDDALSNVSSVRAKLGAFQKNTLESNTSSLRVANENLSAAESNLRDTDMAEEMTRFTRNQIMLSAGIAMLAQANQTPKSVLQLLSPAS